MKNPRISKRKEITKFRAEINAKETKENIAKINKPKSWFFDQINKIDMSSNLFWPRIYFPSGREGEKGQRTFS